MTRDVWDTPEQAFERKELTVANATYNLPLPPNEPVKSYAPGTPERETLKTKLTQLRCLHIEIFY